MSQQTLGIILMIVSVICVGLGLCRKSRAVVFASIAVMVAVMLWMSLTRQPPTEAEIAREAVVQAEEAAARAKAVRMEELLKEAQPGAIIVWSKGTRRLMVMFNPHNSYHLTIEHPLDPQNENIKWLAGFAERVVDPSDPDWCEQVREYLPHPISPPQQQTTSK